MRRHTYKRISKLFIFLFLIFLPILINRIDPISINSQTGDTISGLVYDDYGYPIENAHVKLFIGILDIIIQYEFIDTQDTSSTGAYRFSNLDAPFGAQYFLEVSTDSSSSVLCMGEFRELLGPSPEYWDTDFVLIPADGICTFRGYVFEKPGYIPVYPATVQIISRYGVLVKETSTNSLGFYKFTNIPYQGSYVKIKVIYYQWGSILRTQTKIVYPIDGGTKTTNFYFRIML